MKHVNQPVMIAHKKYNVENYKEDIVDEKEEIIKKKDMENKEIMREKNMKIISPQYENEL